MESVLEPATSYAPPADVRPLAARLRQDRLDRIMTWHQYAAFVGISITTLRRICFDPDYRPHKLTLAKIKQRVPLV